MPSAKQKKKQYETVKHTFEPVYDENSKILILGSFPSVKSREQAFYYGHPQNRFWKVIAKITGQFRKRLSKRKDYCETGILLYGMSLIPVKS